MKRYTVICAALAAFMLLALAGCASSGIPTSSLMLRDASDNSLISTSRTMGSVDVAIGEKLPVQVIRTFKNNQGQTINEDVTQFANFNWFSNGSIAAVDPFGNVTGLAPGAARLEVKFRESSFDPWDIVLLEIVVPNP